MTLNLTNSADFEWQTALQAMHAADAVFQQFKDRFANPLYQREDELLAAHNLIAPGGGCNATPGYYERRNELRATNPDCFVSDNVSDALERLCERFCDAQTVVMNVPAPDMAALRWKLDHILLSDGGCQASWSVEYVKQMLADIDRLVPREGAE